VQDFGDSIAADIGDAIAIAAVIESGIVAAIVDFEGAAYIWSLRGSIAMSNNFGDSARTSWLGFHYPRFRYLILDKDLIGRLIISFCRKGWILSHACWKQDD